MAIDQVSRIREIATPVPMRRKDIGRLAKTEKRKIHLVNTVITSQAEDLLPEACVVISL